MQKIDYKSAYQRMHFNWRSAIQSITQYEEFGMIALRATFGGCPGPYKWGVISELTADLANILMNHPDWNPDTLHSPNYISPKDNLLPIDIPFVKALPTIVEPPIKNHGKSDIYIDDNTMITVDIGDNLKRARAAIPLAIHIIGRPVDPKGSIPCLDLISIDKLKDKGALEEEKVIIGWCFNTRKLTLSLPNHKFKAWNRTIELIQKKRGNKQRRIGNINWTSYPCHSNSSNTVTFSK